jgi:hypothetical protein
VWLVLFLELFGQCGMFSFHSPNNAKNKTSNTAQTIPKTKHTPLTKQNEKQNIPH